MGKIFMIMGKSAAGKDLIYHEILHDEALGLFPLVLYTTRPMRKGETNGKEYYFSDEDHLKTLRSQGRIIEERVYHTVHGAWYYFTADEGQIDTDTKSYLTIGTLQSFIKMRNYFGERVVLPLYIETDNYIRLMRALNREKMQGNPAYSEVCRRYLADEEDFSEINLAKSGVNKRFSNDHEPQDCIDEVKEYIKQEIVANE